MKLNNIHDFLTLGDLKSFNESVEYNIKEDGQKQSHPFDSNRFESTIVNPSDLPDDILYQLSDIIDKKTNLDTPETDTNTTKGPNTIDKLLASLAVAYVTEDNIPVGVATIVDPTIENYMGITPLDFYSLKAATNLENRIQQEFFTVIDEYKQMGIASELRRLLETVAPAMFVVPDVSDKDTINGLKNNGYVYVNQFNTDWDTTPVQLWLN
jgi:hypothetical protein